MPLSTTTAGPPTGQTSEAGPSTSAPTTGVSAPATAPDQGPSLSMQNMMKEMEALEAQMAELQGTKDKLAAIEEKCDKSKQSVAGK